MGLAHLLSLSLLILATIHNVEANCWNHLLYRTLDGTCNNILFPAWGSTDQFFVNGPEGREPYPWVDVPQVRPLPTFSNASTLPSPGPRGSSRFISNTLSVRSNETPESPIPHSNFAVFFGQFLNHDFENNRHINASSRAYFPLVDYITNVNDPTCAAVTFPPPAAPYRCNPENPVPTSEARFSGGVYDSQGRFKVRNNSTSYLDLNQVYGTTHEVNRALRTLSGGRFITETKTINLTPTGGVPTAFTFTDTLSTWATTGIENFDPILYLRTPDLVWSQGDGRVNENLALGVMHLIWTREHNLNADAVLAAHPHWDPVEMDEEIFQRARAITIAKYQKIVYEEYFPNEFGNHFTQKLGSYRGYNPLENADVLLPFASAAFRYGHVSLNPWSPRNVCGVKSLYNISSAQPMPFMGQTAAGPLSMSPLGVVAVAGGFESVVRGLVSQVAAPTFLEAASEIRNIRLPAGVVDLISLDILRARHNQLPNYQKIRSTWYDSLDPKERNIYGSTGCPSSLKNSASDDPLACFEKITGAGSPYAPKLKSLYKKILHIDPFIGMMAESHVAGTSFSRTTGNIITEQYRLARDGDRFFYKKLLGIGYFSPTFASQIQSATMSSVLERVFPGIVVPKNPWLVDPNYVADLAASCSQ